MAMGIWRLVPQGATWAILDGDAPYRTFPTEAEARAALAQLDKEQAFADVVDNQLRMLLRHGARKADLTLEDAQRVITARVARLGTLLD